MNRMPRTTGAHVVRSLRKVGFELVRQRGSHAIMKHPVDQLVAHLRNLLLCL